MEAERDTESGESAEYAAGPPRTVSPGRKTRRGSGSRWLFLLVLALLLSMVVAVVWILPRHVDPVEEMKEEEPPTATTPQPPTETETRRARSKREAENALQDYLRLQAVMEAQEAAVWGGEDYESALQTLARADASFANENFEQARTGYETATQMLESLQESKPRRLCPVGWRRSTAMMRIRRGRRSSSQLR